jgi:hypothetical protein
VQEHDPVPEASGVAPDARSLFEELTAPGPGRFRITADPPRLAEEVKPDIFIKKYLPRSYRAPACTMTTYAECDGMKVPPNHWYNPQTRKICLAGSNREGCS